MGIKMKITIKIKNPQPERFLDLNHNLSASCSE